MGVPPNGWFIREKPIKMHDLGVSPFMEASKWKRWNIWNMWISMLVFCLLLAISMWTPCARMQGALRFGSDAPRPIVTGWVKIHGVDAVAAVEWTWSGPSEKRGHFLCNKTPPLDDLFGSTCVNFKEVQKGTHLCVHIYIYVCIYVYIYIHRYV